MHECEYYMGRVCGYVFRVCKCICHACRCICQESVKASCIVVQIRCAVLYNRCVFLFVCHIYSEYVVTIYSDCVDAYKSVLIHMPGVHVCNPFV